MTSRPALATTPTGFMAFQAIVPGVSQTVAYTGSSSQSTAFGAPTSLVRIFSTTDCFIAFGGSPTASAASIWVPGGIIQFFGVNHGEKLAVIESTATGNLYILEGAGV